MEIRYPSKKKMLAYSIIAILFYDLFFFLFFSVVSLIGESKGMGYEAFMEKNYIFWDFVACALILPIYIYIYRKKTPRSLLKGKMKILKTTGIALGSMGISTLIMVLIHYVASKSQSLERLYESFDDKWQELLQGNYIWILLSVVILGPIIEELLFRGIVINLLNESFTRMWSIIISALLFGIWHKDPIQMLYTAVFGIVLGMVYSRTNNLMYPIYMHILNNLFNSLPGGWMFETLYYYVNILSLILVIPAVIMVIKRGKEEIKLSLYDV